MAVVKKTTNIPKIRITKEAFLEHKSSIIVNFSTERYPYSKIMSDYRLVISGGKLQEASGFDSSNYYKILRGERDMLPGPLMSICFLCKVTPQDAHDIFHLCKDTDELQTYGTPALVLSYLLDDTNKSKTLHTYAEFIRYTLFLLDDKKPEVPDIFNNCSKWRKMCRAVRK